MRNESLSTRVDERLGAAEVAEVLDLVEQAAQSDSVTPLSEHVLLHLRHGGDEGDRHVRVHRDNELVGYAHIDLTDEVEGASAELVVAPQHRRTGVGDALMKGLVGVSADGRLRLWAHGGHTGAAHLARAHGFDQVRVLWQMRRSLHSALPTPRLPAGVRLRTFEPGVDDDEWLAVNARAFAELPDQGGWTRADLDRRLQEPWFDPTGFLVAVTDDPDGVERMVGFHWTKIHGGHTHTHSPSHSHSHGHEPMGEVYVVGVLPEFQGSGLGRALVLAGLAHLRSRGLAQAMLYVDAQNTTAIRLYESLGFARWDTDILYRRVT
jgi:mycothiol synthase